MATVGTAIAGAPGAPQSANTGLAHLLSPSQVACFTDCSAKWWFKYGLKLPDPKNANLALGIATHEALAEYYQLRVEGTAVLEPGDVAEEFSLAWRGQLAGDTVLRDEEDPAELEATGRALVSRYVAEIAPAVEPAAVEQSVEGVIGGVRVQGKVDLIELNGRIREIKTASRRPNGVSHQHAFQLATYCQITPGAVAAAAVDTLVKTKTPQLETHFLRIGAAELDYTRRLYPLAQEGMRAGLYVPNRASSLCSRRSCAFWRHCEAEFGGRVSQ
jgi:putative RecB family exonuclease